VVERERDELREQYDAFTKEFLDMSTREALAKADYFVNTNQEVTGRILFIVTPNREIEEVFWKFAAAYLVEGEAYHATQASFVLGREERLHTSIELFAEADTMFDEAYGRMNTLLRQFGLTWSDIY